MKIAKYVNVEPFPENMFKGDLSFNSGARCEEFTKFFIKLNGAYNGKCKLIVQNSNFMTVKDVAECMAYLNNKKCEGFDRIPVCILSDSLCLQS